MKFKKPMMETAKIWSKMSYCKRAQVGAVLSSKDGRILATGYNGTLSGQKNICEEKIYKCSYCLGHSKTPIIENGKCSICNTKLKEEDVEIEYITNEFVLHAEQNVITYCAKNGIPTKDTILYVTMSPCKTCAKLIVQAGIKKVIYLNKYRDIEGIQFLKQFIEVEHYDEKL